MVHRQRVHCDPEAQPLGSLGCGAKHDVRRGQKRKSRLAVNLRDPKGNEAQAIGELGLI
jgi:hypothetical protein